LLVFLLLIRPLHIFAAQDYFDSGWYFDAGVFHMPVSGFTHLLKSKNATVHLHKDPCCEFLSNPRCSSLSISR